MAWHRLETEKARRLLFAEFTCDGRVVGLIEAIVATARHDHTPGSGPFSPIPLRPQDRASLEAMLEGALIGALSEALDASTLVLDAWREAFRLFMRRLEPA